MSKPKPQPDSSKSASLRFDYHSAYNEIVNPKHFVSSSLYYVQHWIRPLCANGHMIVTVLRSHGYFDTVHGQHRDAVDIDQKTLAAECGMSLSTFQREFVKNIALAKFVQREFIADRDKIGRILREHYVYRVKMDDPLIPSDQARFEAMLQGPDKGDNPICHFDISGDLPMMQNDASAQQIAVPMMQNDVPDGQIDAPYNKVIPTLTTLNTLTTPTATPEISASLFPEQTSPAEDKEPEADRPFKSYRAGAAKLLEAIEEAKKGKTGTWT